MSARIPPLIQPYLSLPPESSLVLLTSVLGASANWLVLRYLQELLKPASALQNNHEHVSIFLVSFLRDFSFWKDGSSRLGLDLEAAAQRGLFKYLDGLQVLVCSNEDRRYNPIVPETTSGWRQPLQSQSLVAIANRIKEGLMHLKRAPLTGFDKGHSLEPKKVVLVLDGLDLLLATLESPKQDGEETLIAFRDMLIDMREHTHAMIITLETDDPLIKEQQSVLEQRHAWFAIGLAHDADMLLSLRLLDTGVAKDVSGVIRITCPGDGIDHKDEEFLYHVGGDGGVRVFERGQQ